MVVLTFWVKIKYFNASGFFAAVKTGVRPKLSLENIITVLRTPKLLKFQEFFLRNF